MEIINKTVLSFLCHPDDTVNLHPVTIMQNARTSGGGVVTGIPIQAITVGPVQTWKAEKVSIWQAGMHDNRFFLS